MKRLLLFAFTLLTSATVFGQINYYFSYFQTDFEYLQDAEAAVTETWDDPNAEIPIGFDFTSMGTTTNTLYMSDNFYGGTLVLDDMSPTWDMIWATSGDLIDAGYADGMLMSPITYETSGEPGTRIFKLEWKNCGTYEEYAQSGTAANQISLQLWLYEGSNDVEIRWGPNTIKQSDLLIDDFFSTGLLDDATMNNDIGYAMFVGGSANAPSLFEGSTVDELQLASLLSIPSNGMVYRFSTTPVSVEENTSLEWNVYPTATNGLVNFRSNSTEQVDYQLLDLSGRIIDQGLFTGFDQVDISNESKGIYLVRFAAEDEVKTFKIVRQ
ncbi:MAG: T9SS type A sorting domain-containing protein [Flavobacteriales bacterium]|nr:T9SS type A sorting domain-containing protein [Flavobacteriales bacterium]